MNRVRRGCEGVAECAGNGGGLKGAGFGLEAEGGWSAGVV